MFKNRIDDSRGAAIQRSIIVFICGAGFGAGLALKNWISVLFGICIGIGAILDIRGATKDIENYSRKDEKVDSTSLSMCPYRNMYLCTKESEEEGAKVFCATTLDYKKCKYFDLNAKK